MSRQQSSSLLIRICVTVVLLSFALPAYPQQDQPEREITNSIGMRLVLIPAGSFMMGSSRNDPDAADDEFPQHQVTISRPFYMSACEVTQKQYEDVMGVDPSDIKGADLPVECISWLDAELF
jgi:formylglycine-generating enzyme required for sulfatase activity